MKNFINFVRAQGVVGLAVGFILGGAVQKVVTSLVTDIVNPILGVILSLGGNFNEAALIIGPVKIMWGHFLSVLIDFLVISAVVYFLVHGLKLDRLDKKKTEK